MAEHGIGELRGSGERLILVAEDVTEEAVHRGEHLRARPVVLRQREHALRVLPALAEDLDVRVAEAVDRLELVAHREDLGEIRMRDQIDELALQSIRVLELVDHDDPEPELRLLPHGLVIPQEITGCQLEILEVDRRLPALGGRVLRRETLEQLLQEIAVGRGELLEGGALGGLPCQLERRGARSLGGECRQIDQALGWRRGTDDAERLGRIAPLRHGGGRVVGELLRLGSQPRYRVLEARALAELEHQLATRRAHRLEHAGEHSPQPVCAVGREQPQALVVTARTEVVQRALERLAAQNRSACVLELAKARIQPRSERMGSQETVAEAVDRRDPRGVEPAREIGPTSRSQRGTDPAAELACRLPRVGDDEDRLDVDTAVADGLHVTLDENRGLAGAGSRGDEHRSRGVDGGKLLVVQRRGHVHDRHGRGTRHIGQRSHHAGQPSPFGSCWTSPARMRTAFSSARSRADSTCAQNASSSR